MGDFLTGHAAAAPDKVAVVEDRPDGAVRLTNVELEAAANRLAAVLADHGVVPGRTVVWCGPNSIGVVTFLAAARKLGAIAVPLNYRLAPDEAAYVTDHSDAEVVYVDTEYAPLFAGIRPSLPKVRHVLVFDGGAGGDVPEGMVDADAAAAVASPDVVEPPEAEATGATMIYTSGTTGKPKGALRRQALDPGAVMGLVMLIGYTADDVYLTTGPLYHSGPSGFMGIGQALGQTVVVQRRFDPEDWLRLVDTYRVTSTFSAPTPIRMACSLPDDVKARYDRSSMRRMVANAAPWSQALKRMYLADFPEDSLWEVYGSTELGVNTVLAPADQLRKPGSCGLAAPAVDIRLYDDGGHEVTATGPDHTGQLFARSSAVFSDYYKQHDRYEAERRDGYQTVGDIAYRDDEGYFYICDRKNDMIISGGMNIYPAEIEAALDAHPDIYEVAVFGIPSEEWGETVHAVVVPQPGAALAADDVVAFARQHLASYKAPRSVEFLDELPKTGSGKVLKRQLRAPHWADRATNV